MGSKTCNFDSDEDTDEEYRSKLDGIPPLTALVKEYQPDVDKKDSYFLKELLLWGLVAHKKLSKHRFEKGYQLKDLYSSYIKDL